MPAIGDARRLLDLKHELAARASYPIDAYFPETGPLRRGKYLKHMEFFAAGSTHKERLFMAGNRVGKSDAGAYEMTCHLTGIYPVWWVGKRFTEPIEAWASGTTAETTRDIIQTKLLGPWKTVDSSSPYAGMIPRHLIVGTSRRPHGIPGAIETVWVRHSSGGVSQLGLKSYIQGRESYEGTAKHVVWCLAEGELVQMHDGRLVPIEQITPGDVVASIDTRGRVVGRVVTATHDHGEKPCVEVRPKHGTPVICTADHDLYWGYRRASKAPAGSATAIAQPRPGCFWPDHTVDRADAWYVWMALVVAEGSVASRKITCGDEMSLQRAIAMLPPDARVRKKVFKNGHVPDWHLMWPEFWRDCPPGHSADKQIPAWVFTSSREKARLFLRWLYMGDGWTTAHMIGYATTSRMLAHQLVVLLNRLGVRARVTTRAHERWSRQYWVQISRADDVKRFLDEIGIEGKADACARVGAEAARRIESKRQRATHLVTHGRRTYQGRDSAAREKASRVLAIEHVGPRRVYDLTVEQEHRFLCGTSLVSNCDEEPPGDIYTEGLYRTLTTKGIVYTTFTPLQGMSDVVTQFLEADEAAKASKVVIQAGWNDVPHLDATERALLIASTPPYQRAARTTGTPTLGAGAIYGLPEEELKIADFPIPKHWKRVWGGDAGGGAKPTAVVWLALDPDQGVVYLYSTYKRESPEPAIHLAGIKARGAWIPGVMDSAALIITKDDAEQLISVYQRGGLTVSLPDKAVESGIQAVWEAMSEQRFRVFASCEAWFAEFRKYHRDAKGRIVKKDDHLMDATRYAVYSGLAMAKNEADITVSNRRPYTPAPIQGGGSTGYMGS